MIKAVVLAVFLVSAFMASAQQLYTRVINSGEEIYVEQNKTAEIVFASGGLIFQSYYGSVSLPIYFSESSKYPFYFAPSSYNNPVYGFIRGSSAANTTVTYRIIDSVAVGSPTTNYIPASAVVIPADSTGSVRIILESSVDLITWTEAEPGTYGSSTSKRFFRVRAVNQ